MSTAGKRRARKAPPKPGVLFHGGPVNASTEAYQEQLLTVLQYGSKVAGLLILPPTWVPPFAALPAWLSEEWQANEDQWVAVARRNGIDMSKILRLIGENGRHEIILRSSAVGEGLGDRGQYQSIKLPRNAGPDDATEALETIYAGLLDKGRHMSMGICIQRYVTPEIAGHTSNELRLSATRNQWKYEIEQPSYVPNKGLNSKFAYSPPEDEPPRVLSQINLSRALRGVCHWINLRIGGRSHVEWCVSSGRLWALQLDEESPTSVGENPHAMPSTHFGEPTTAPETFSCFQLYKVQKDTKWKKLTNVRDFWIDEHPPKHRLFFATAQTIKEILGKEDNRTKLAQEIDYLTRSRAVLRTDCCDPKVQGFNLPRTHTVSGADAVIWLEKTTEEMLTKGIAAEDIAFILHQYIPARGRMVILPTRRYIGPCRLPLGSPRWAAVPQP